MRERIVAACAKHDCYQILGRSNLDEPLPEMDAYEHVGILESVGITGKHRIAWVAVKPVLADKLHVIEKIGTNRHSFDLKVFTEERAALRWLSAGS